VFVPQIIGDPDFSEVTLKLSVTQSPNAPPENAKKKILKKKAVVKLDIYS